MSYEFHSKDRGLSALVGQRVVSIAIDDAHDAVLRIVTNAGTWTLTAEGDCCSESWFDRQHLEGADIVAGHVITAVEKRTPLGDPNDGRTRQESDQIYSTEIRTAVGACVFEMRNSSNGYYGGEFEAAFEAGEVSP